MSEAKGEHEPSMEEILASIRRIIAEDGDAAGSVQGAAPPPPSMSGGPRQDEVLELTEVVEEDGSVVSIGAKSAAPEPPLAPKPPPQPAVFEPDEPELPPPSPRETLELDDDEHLISAEAAAASIAALSQLAASRSSGRSEDILVSAGGRTIEELVCEMLRPLLKTWLDDNLPQLVERLVQDEINRLVREAHGR